MWQQLMTALALMLVIEGVIPFINPAAMRRAILTMARMDDPTLRKTGLISMVLGVILLYLLK